MSCILFIFDIMSPFNKAQRKTKPRVALSLEVPSEKKCKYLLGVPCEIALYKIKNGQIFLISYGSTSLVT